MWVSLQESSKTVLWNNVLLLCRALLRRELVYRTRGWEPEGFLPGFLTSSQQLTTLWATFSSACTLTSPTLLFGLIVGKLCPANTSTRLDFLPAIGLLLARFHDAGLYSTVLQKNTPKVSTANTRSDWVASLIPWHYYFTLAKIWVMVLSVPKNESRANWLQHFTSKGLSWNECECVFTFWTAFVAGMLAVFSITSSISKSIQKASVSTHTSYSWWLLM